MQFHGTRAFILIWLGQSISLLCSGLTGFALGVWVYQQTGSITRFALIALFTTLPGIIISPLAGALVDRWGHRRAMILGDSGAGLCTLIVALLTHTGSLAIWHIYLLMGVSSIMNAIQWPAFSAVTTLMVPKRELGRASGLVQLGQAGAQIVAPMLAGWLLAEIRIDGILLLDVASFAIAVLTLSLARIPGYPRADERGTSEGSLLRGAGVGWTYIVSRPGLLGLLLFFAATNFTMGMLQVLMTPLVLSMASAEVLGVVLSVAGIGMLAGSVTMSAWGGPARRIHGVLGVTLLQGCLLLVLGLFPFLPLVIVGAFLFLFCTPIVIGSSQAIWQSKVAIDVQGRVFAVRRMIALSAVPLAYLLAGPLVERVFKPLSRLLGHRAEVVGEGAVPAIGLLFSALGAGTILVTIAGWCSARLHRVEAELPDAEFGEKSAVSG
jgi:MFS family permease